MAAPNVFVSSTFYDLRYIRERISYFIRSLGYNPILSEAGAVYYDPRRDAAEACVAEIPNCQMFVLVIGGRYGSEHPDETHSVTNAEYKEACRLRIPIFALVEQGAFSDYQLFRANKDRDGFDAGDICFPNADDPRIFAFVDEVRSQAINNALVPFRDYSDIESYLRQQWAGMLHAFLTGLNEEQRVQDMLSVITSMNRRIELLSTRILESVGTDREQALARIYSRMLTSQAVSDLGHIGLQVTPSSVLEYETFAAYAEREGKPWDISAENFAISSTGSINRDRWRSSTRDYETLRRGLLEDMDTGGLTREDLASLDGTGRAQQMA